MEPKGCLIHLRGDTIYGSTLYFGEHQIPVYGKPVFTCAASAEALCRNIPVFLQASGLKDAEFLKGLLRSKPNPLLRIAKVRSQQEFQRGTSACTLICSDRNYTVNWLFPAQDQRGFVGSPDVPDSIFQLDDALTMAVELLKHLSNPVNRYPS